MIYFAQQLTGGPIKIGYSADPVRRVAALAATQANGLYILATMTGGVADEFRIHKSLSSYRLEGEWFAPEPEVLAAVEMARESETIETNMEKYEGYLRETFPIIFNEAFPSNTEAAVAASVTLKQALNWRIGKNLPTLPSMIGLCRQSQLLKWWFLAMGAAFDCAERERCDIRDAFAEACKSPDLVQAFWKGRPAITLDEIQKLLQQRAK